ncbi:MAG: M28 family peptidase [Chloroflexota bacterium]
MLDTYLDLVAKTDAKARQDGLLAALEQIGIDYSINTHTIDGQTVDNIRVPMHQNEMPYILVGVHYDAIARSEGANKNAAGVAIALGILRVFYFIRRTKARPLPLEFVFFDGYHQQMAGSRAYANHCDPSQIQVMINLDLCGVGDVVLVARGEHVLDSHAEKAIRQLETSPYHPALRMLDLLPPSDDRSFAEKGIPTATVSIAPDEDVVPIVGLAVALHNKEQVAVLPSIYQAVHQPTLDTVDTIQIDAMRQVMLIVNALISNLLKLMPDGIDWK